VGRTSELRKPRSGESKEFERQSNIPEAEDRDWENLGRKVIGRRGRNVGQKLGQRWRPHHEGREPLDLVESGQLGCP
jgi:hypothetical protein